MSLADFAPGLAQSLIGAAGTAVTFTRAVPDGYDPISGVVMPPAPLTWTGVAVVVPNASKITQPTDGLEPTAQRRTMRTLLVSGLDLRRPQPEDVVALGATTLRVTDVTNVGDVTGGTVPAYRVECVA